MKRSNLLIFILILALCATLFVACNDPDSPAAKCKVTFYDGETEVKSVEVEEGGLTAEQIPNAPEGHDGEEFVGWYVGEQKVEVGYEPEGSVSAYAKFQPAVPNWSEDEQALMRYYLHGMVLPYFDKDNNVVDYDEETDEITIAGAKVTRAEVDAYAELYTAEDGWSDASDMYEEDESSEYYHVFKNILDTEEGERYIVVEFGALDEEGSLTQDGDFVLVAYDPYFYEFPTAFFDAYIAAIFFEEGAAIPLNDHIPTYDNADYFMVTLYDGPYHLPLPGVMCYTEQTNAEDQYIFALQQRQWIIGETDEEGYIYAYSNDSAVAVEFKYSEEMKGLVIYMTLPPVIPEPEWPDYWLTQAFKTYNQPAFAIPEFDYPGAMYGCYEDENNLEYAVGDKSKAKFVIEAHGATEAIFNAYLEELEADGWAQSEGTDAIKVFTKEIDEKIATIDLTYGDVIVINVYLFMKDKPGSVWPAEELVAYINDEYITDVIPAYEGSDATGYYVHEETNSYYAYVEILLPEGNEDAAVSSYKASLDKAGYTGNANGWYLSGNKQLEVMPEKATGAIRVYFRLVPIEAWPDYVVEGEFEKYGYTDTLPALDFEGATYLYKTTTAYAPECVHIEVEVGYDDAEQQFAAYKAALEEAGFVESSEYEDDLIIGYVFYVSPNGQYKVEVWIMYSSTICIEVTPID